ncbi:glycosyltransferase [Bacillus sp. FJAT-50079]|uniref:glycosyltransferase n=1 Tax=Bacillus sp. FJAT-50079 TaxID=2833577 RepID=UPI001BC99F9A|nr:glycosyltransferase [Bacillus sp. FJAT-50079]MBS4206748.1 glycosyltransferase [Bacillus sp. FJAT-50079]
MKICYLAPANSIHTIKWLNAFIEKNYEVHLLTMHPPDHDKLHPNIHLHKLRYNAPFGYYLNALQAKFLLKKINPDIFHVHYASGYGTLGRFINFRPMLLSVWGSDVFEFPFQSKSKRNVLKKNLESADQVLSTSYSMKDQTKSFFIPKREIQVTPFGVDTEKFKPAEIVKVEQTITIGIIKLLEPVYGIKYLIDAFALIIDELLQGQSDTTPKLKLLIVGHGSQRAELESRARYKGIHEYVDFYGAVPNDNVPSILNKIDIFCVPSLSESFGVAVIEASACGVPVVVSDVGGLPEVVENNITGFIVEPKNVNQLAEKLLKLIQNPSMREIMGKSGREFVLEKYNWQDNVNSMEKIYTEMVANQSYL